MTEIDRAIAWVALLAFLAVALVVAGAMRIAAGIAP